MPHSPPFSGTTARAVIAPASDLLGDSLHARHDAAERRRMTRRLRLALAEGDLLLYYQPLVTLNSGRIRGVEALVRLQHHRLGLLPASQFMQGAEDADIIVKFGRWQLEQLGTEMATWPEPISVAVTLAQRQLRERSFIRQFLEWLIRTGIGPERLEVRLTEAMLDDTCSNTAFSLKLLQGLGARLALTYVGPGFAALPALRYLRFTTLRLDRALIHQLDNGPDGNAIVRAAIEAAHRLGCAVLADGVDTKRQYSRLLKMGCDEGQGNYFSPPLAAAQLAARLTPADRTPENAENG